MYISEIPNSLKATALYIWKFQNELNKVSHPLQKGTIELSRESPEVVNNLLFDYQLALSSEVQELVENRFWKHWSKEAKNGHRWELISNSDKGEGTHQNELVEVIDILFFTVSILQVARVSEDFWVNEFTKSNLWSPAPSLNGKDIAYSAHELQYELSKATFDKKFSTTKVISTLISLFNNTQLKWEDVIKLYSQKLIINFERQHRGRTQINDLLSHTENLKVVKSIDNFINKQKT